MKKTYYIEKRGQRDDKKEKEKKRKVYWENLKKLELVKSLQRGDET